MKVLTPLCFLIIVLALPAAASFDLIILPTGKYSDEAKPLPLRTSSKKPEQRSQMSKNPEAFEKSPGKMQAIIQRPQPQGLEPLSLLDENMDDATVVSFSDPIMHSGATNLKKVETWRAKKGERVQDVLTRWAGRAGVRMEWTALKDARLKDDISHFGNFSGAVDAVLFEADRELGGMYRGPNNPYIHQSIQMPNKIPNTNMNMPAVPAAQVNIMRPDQIPASLQGPLTFKTWIVQENQYLRNALEAWSEEAGVGLIWRTGDDWVVGDTVSLTGAYQDAVNTVLEQLNKQKIRPIATLYNDPVSGEFLVIESVGQKNG